jgi:hypothetical protein
LTLERLVLKTKIATKPRVLGPSEALDKEVNYKEDEMKE